jgi:hypothetical protein
MGLGFSFGAKDTGLDATLAGIDSQFKTIADSLSNFQDIAAEGLTPAEESVRSLGDAIGEVQAKAAEGLPTADIAGDLEDSFADVGGAASEISIGDGIRKGMADLQAESDTWSLDDINIDASDAVDQVDDLGGALGGMAGEAVLGGTKFGRMANSVLGGAGKITGALGWVGMALGPIISGFGQAAESAGGMVDAIAGLPSRAGDAVHRIANEGINLTHSLEAEAVGLSTTARAVGANMGYVGQELNRFTGRATGMAMGLNVGADEAARALRAVDEAGSELAAMSLGNARDVARFQAAFGVNADLLRNAGLSMRNELGMGDEAIGQITSSMAAMGQQTGDVAGAINQINDLMALLRRRRALGDTPEQLQQFASDTAAAARGMFEFTQDSELVRQTAAQLAEQLTENRESFRNMFAGAEAEFPQLMTELSIVSGGVDQAFESMTQGPGQFMEAMGNIVGQVRARGGDVGATLEFMRGRLQQVFGADQTATMINFWSNMTDETTDAMRAVRGAEVDLGDLARQAHRTGRTMDEVFERMRGFFQVAMRRFARSDSRDFLRNTRESLRDLQVAAEEAHRSQGPLSDVMGLLSRSQQLGALALMPAELRGSAVAADELRGQIMPLIQAFTSWGSILDTVLGYVSIFATDVIAEWGQITRRSRQAGEEAIDPMEALGLAIDRQAQRYATIFEDWIDDIEGWVVRAAEAFGSLNFDRLFQATPEGSEDTGVMGAIRRVLERLGDIDWGRIWTGIRTGLENLFEHVQPWLEQKMDQIRTIIWNRIGEWWDAIDWEAVFRGTGEVGGGLWSAFEPALSVLGDMISQWLSDHWMEIILYGAVALTAAMALLIVLGVAALVAALVASVALIAAAVMSPFIVVGAELAAWGDEIGRFFLAMWLDFTDWVEDFGEDFEDTMLEIDAFFTSTWRRTTRWFRNLWTGVANWFGGLWQRITEVFNQAVQDWQMVFESIGGFFTGLGQSIRDTVGGAVAWIGEQWEAFVGSLQGVWEGLSSGWDTFLSSAQEVWDNLMGVPDRLRAGWEGIVGFFRTIFTSLRAVVGEDLQAVGQIFTSMSDVATSALNAILGTAEENHGNSVHTLIEQDLAQAAEFIQEMATSVSETITAVLHDAMIAAIVDAFATGFATVSENMEEFAEGMIGQFQTMAESISEIMTDLFVAVLDQSEQTLLGTETAVSGIIARLRTITTAQARLTEERAGAVSSLARPADEEAMRRRLAQLQGNDVLRAIHHPDWYSGVAGEGGYQRLFIAKMNELREAVSAIGAAPAAGGVAEARRRIEGNRETVRRGRIGGQPGLPGGPGR